MRRGKKADQRAVVFPSALIDSSGRMVTDICLRVRMPRKENPGREQRRITQPQSPPCGGIPQRRTDWPTVKSLTVNRFGLPVTAAAAAAAADCCALKKSTQR